MADRGIWTCDTHNYTVGKAGRRKKTTKGNKQAPCGSLTRSKEDPDTSMEHEALWWFWVGDCVVRQPLVA